MKPSFKAFTLTELMIVLVIMGIIVMMVMSLSGYHIQTLQQKVVKEKILSTYQSYYSRNLTSSYSAGERYETMHLDLVQ
ncbi:MAG: type II secretion system GspH family protein [Candidatus Peribacteria bacterium]|jgi:prepilin-type N-terminal cleavage/methylation domain-containing protein|nr:type II secretion system GspH family protein [Candidatus Peribacteria bacterium]